MAAAECSFNHKTVLLGDFYLVLLANDDAWKANDAISPQFGQLQKESDK